MRLLRRRPKEQDASEIERLTASRRAIVEAYEVERQRIERDLHDGTQQYLVAASMALGEAELSPVIEKDPQLRGLLAQAHAHLDRAMESLRATVRGIHPQVLLDHGLVAALEDVVRHGTQRVWLRCPHRLPTLPEGVLACAYFFTIEVLTNAAKYAPDSDVDVLITVGEQLRIAVLDRGPGGATITPSRGLAGMVERLAAFGGELWLSSPRGGPTQVVAAIPLLLFHGEPSVPAPAWDHRTGQSR